MCSREAADSPEDPDFVPGSVEIYHAPATVEIIQKFEREPLNIRICSPVGIRCAPGIIMPVCTKTQGLFEIRGTARTRDLYKYTS